MAATPMPRPAMATMPARVRMIVMTVAGCILARVSSARTGVGTRAGAGLADVADLHWRSGRRALAAGWLQHGCSSGHRVVRVAVEQAARRAQAGLVATS